MEIGLADGWPRIVVFSAICLVLIIVDALFDGLAGLRIKKAFHIPLVIISMAAFLLFLNLLMQGYFDPWVVYPAAALIILIDLVTVRFCDSCGRTNRWWLKRRRPCRRCGGVRSP